MVVHAVPSYTRPLLHPIWPLPERQPAVAARVPPPPRTPAAAHGNIQVDLDEAVRSLEDRGPNCRAFYNSLISLCVSETALREGERLRSHLARVGYEPDVFLENQFLNLYAKCGKVARARERFDAMRERNAVSWNAMIAGYCSNGCFLDAAHLFAAMIEAGDQTPNRATYLSALRASAGSGDLRHGRQVHARLVKAGLFPQVEVGNSLINMYAKLGSPEDAGTVFENMAQRDAVTWNIAIAASARSSLGGDEAIVLFIQMNEEGFEPDEFTFTSLLGSEDVAGPAELHTQIAKRGLEGDVYVGSALLDAYARTGNPREARLVFNRMPRRNTTTWNSIIAACVQNDALEEGLRLFMEMQKAIKLPDVYTISSLLTAAALESSISVGKQVHGLAAKLGLCSDTLVGNTLVTMYSKQGLVSDSRRSFQDTADLDLISWNSIIQAHADNEKHEEALALLVDMKHSGVEPDKYTFVSASVACASLSWKRTGRAIHGAVVKCDAEVDGFMGSALVDMYVKCAAVAEAKQVFDEISEKDLITWNAMVVGFSRNGCLDRALELLSTMREAGLEPDNFTFSGILSGCAAASALQSGRQIHALVVKSDTDADTAVANAMTTMYARSGCTREAWRIFSRLAARNTASWTAIIGGYAQSGRPREALQLFEQMTMAGAEPSGQTFVAVLTACSYAGMIDEAERHFEAMEAEYGIVPDLEHYACMVDALGRAGRLEEAEDVINSMRQGPNAVVWKALLSACRTHGDLERGRRAMEMVLRTEPGDSAAYVLLSNMYAAAGLWEGVVEIRRLMRENGVGKEPGKSWVEVRSRVHEFVAGDTSHPETQEIHTALRGLLGEMKTAGYVPGP